MEKVTGFSNTILKTVSLSWCAIDFIESVTGDICFLEANTRPGFEGFIARHSDALFVDAYKRGLLAFFKKQ